MLNPFNTFTLCSSRAPLNSLSNREPLYTFYSIESIEISLTPSNRTSLHPLNVTTNEATKVTKPLCSFQFTGDMALYPFLTLHMKSLGISITEIGIQFAISPIACLVATPLVGLIADKIGEY